MLTKDEFFAVPDIVTKEVTLPAPYVGTVFMKSMNGEEGEAFQQSLMKRDATGKPEIDLRHSRAKLLIRCICNEESQLLFSEEDIPALLKKSDKVLEFLVKEANAINGRGESSGN